MHIFYCSLFFFLKYRFLFFFNYFTKPFFTNFLMQHVFKKKKLSFYFTKISRTTKFKKWVKFLSLKYYYYLFFHIRKVKYAIHPKKKYNTRLSILFFIPNTANTSKTLKVPNHQNQWVAYTLQHQTQDCRFYFHYSKWSVQKW